MKLWRKSESGMRRIWTTAHPSNLSLSKLHDSVITFQPAPTYPTSPPASANSGAVTSTLSAATTDMSEDDSAFTTNFVNMLCAYRRRMKEFASHKSQRTPCPQLNELNHQLALHHGHQTRKRAVVYAQQNYGSGHQPGDSNFTTWRYSQCCHHHHRLVTPDSGANDLAHSHPRVDVRLLDRRLHLCCVFVSQLLDLCTRHSESMQPPAHSSTSHIGGAVVIRGSHHCALQGARKVN